MGLSCTWWWFTLSRICFLQTYHIRPPRAHFPHKIHTYSGTCVRCKMPEVKQEILYAFITVHVLTSGKLRVAGCKQNEELFSIWLYTWKCGEWVPHLAASCSFDEVPLLVAAEALTESCSNFEANACVLLPSILAPNNSMYIQQRTLFPP